MTATTLPVGAAIRVAKHEGAWFWWCDTCPDGRSQWNWGSGDACDAAYEHLELVHTSVLS